MAAFGWSAGDVVQSIQLVVKITRALKETGGAKADYQESIEFLLGLGTTLQNLRTLSPLLVNSDQLNLELEKIVTPLSGFTDKAKRFDASLGQQSERGTWRSAPRKVQWAMQVSKEVHKLRERISLPLASINILSQSQTIVAMSALQEKLSGNISDTLLLSIENALSSRLRDEITTLSDSVKTYQQTQLDLTHDIMSAMRTSIDAKARSLVKTQQIDRALEISNDQLIINERSQNNSRLECLLMEQRQDLKTMQSSLITIAHHQELPQSNIVLRSSKELVVSSDNAFTDLKIAFSRCIYLLAKSLHELLYKMLIYLGPQFLLFLLALKQYGNQVPRLLVSDNILFEDFLGQRKYLPFEYFQHFSVFNTFLREAFEGLPGHEYISNQQYQLTDANNTIILSNSWRQLVRRRSKVTMSVILDHANNVLADILVCPRCSSSTSALNEMQMHCSSCGLSLTTSGNGNALKSDLAHTLTTMDQLQSLTPHEDPISRDVDHESNETTSWDDWGEVKVISGPTLSSGTRYGRAMPLQRARFSLDQQDLKHFKHVALQQGNISLGWIFAAYSKLAQEALEIAGEKTLLMSNIEIALSAQDPIETHPSLNLLQSSPIWTRVPSGDWRDKIWKGARQDLENMVRQTKDLFREAITMYGALKKPGRNKSLRSAERVDVMNCFATSLRALLLSLGNLDKLEYEWMYSGRRATRQINTPRDSGKDQIEREIEGVVTCLELTEQYIVVVLDNSRIYVFDHAGQVLHQLVGHVMGLWAACVRGNILVTAGVDRDVRVWNISTGKQLHLLKGHTATIRSALFIDDDTIATSSRDTTIRIWSIGSDHGTCSNVLRGHLKSVRCLAITGNTLVSGSYDTTAKIWNPSDPNCLRTLNGHFSEVYAIACDTQRVITGGLDTSVRIWNINTGECIAALRGHNSMVAHIQILGDFVASGGSDGLVNVWSLESMNNIHQIVVGDMSLTSLQLDHRRIVTGSSDGTVKIFDTRSGKLVRLLGTPSDAIWKVQTTESMAVVVKAVKNRTALEIWSFLDGPNLPTSTPVSSISPEVKD